MERLEAWAGGLAPCARAPKPSSAQGLFGAARWRPRLGGGEEVSMGSRSGRSRAKGAYVCECVCACCHRRRRRRRGAVAAPRAPHRLRPHRPIDRPQPRVEAGAEAYTCPERVSLPDRTGNASQLSIRSASPELDRRRRKKRAPLRGVFVGTDQGDGLQDSDNFCSIATSDCISARFLDTIREPLVRCRRCEATLA